MAARDISFRQPGPRPLPDTAVGPRNQSAFLSVMSSSEKPLVVIQDKVGDLADKNVDSVDSDVRYMAYGARIRTAIRASTRYIAYVCTIGRG